MTRKVVRKKDDSKRTSPPVKEKIQNTFTGIGEIPDTWLSSALRMLTPLMIFRLIIVVAAIIQLTGIANRLISEGHNLTPNAIWGTLAIAALIFLMGLTALCSALRGHCNAKTIENIRNGTPDSETQRGNVPKDE